MSLPPGRPRKNDERNRGIVQAVKAGELPVNVAERLGVRNNVIWTVLNDAGISPQRLKTTRRQKMTDFIKAGGTLEQACKRFSVGSQTIRNACREERVPIPPLLPQTIGRVMPILRLLENAPWGAKLQDIADVYGCTKQRVSQVWKSAKTQGFFDNVIWCNTTGKCPKPDHMKDNNEPQAPA